MRVVPAVVAVVGVAAVAAAVIVVHQSSPVKNAGDVVGYSPTPTAKSIAVLGDSYSSGTAMGGNGDSGWPLILAGLNQLQLRNDSIAGTGYVTNSGSAGAFPLRAKDVVKQNPSIVIVWGARDDLGSGTGDPSSRLRAIAKGMATTLAALKTGLPKAQIVAIGPSWINGNVPAKYTQMDLLERKTAAAAQVHFVDTLGTDSKGSHSWFDKNNAAFIGEDGQHPTDDGNEHAAALIQAALAKFGIGDQAPRASSVVPPVVPTVTTTVTPPPKTVTATTTAPASATPTVTATVTVVPTATVTVLG